MAYETLEIRNEESILWLTLNRPHNLNALSAKMVEEFEGFLADSARRSRNPRRYPARRGTCDSAPVSI